MISFRYVEEILPVPIKVSICFEHYDFLVKQLFEQIREVKQEHNKGMEFPVDSILLDYDSPEWGSELEKNEYKIFIGTREVLSFTGDYSKEGISYVINLISQVTDAVKGVLNAWHDEIVALQKRNAEKICELESQQYDEVLYAYYQNINDKRAFNYLKRLAERYPNSKYFSRLRRIYRFGSQDMHPKNEALANKLSGHDSEKNF